MNTLAKMMILFLFHTVLANAQQTAENSITVKINNLKGNQGKVYIAIYNEESEFLEKIFKATFVTIEKNTCEFTFDNIPNGTYAVSIFHDENDNNKLDSNFLGIPKEDYGCSNNAKGFMGPPKWEDAKFELKDKMITQTITL